MPATELQRATNRMLRRPQRLGLVRLVRRLVCLETGVGHGSSFRWVGAQRVVWLSPRCRWCWSWFRMRNPAACGCLGQANQKCGEHDDGGDRGGGEDRDEHPPPTGGRHRLTTGGGENRHGVLRYGQG